VVPQIDILCPGTSLGLLRLAAFAVCDPLLSSVLSRLNVPSDTQTVVGALNRADLDTQRVVWQRSAQGVLPGLAS